MALPPVPCTNCGDDVAQRRRSSTGLHFCPKSDCQRAKSRAHYRARVQTDANIEKGLILEFIHALAHRPRKHCEACGLVNALPGYRHPTSDGLACAALGSAKMGGLALEIILALWPHESREYREVQS